VPRAAQSARPRWRRLSLAALVILIAAAASACRVAYLAHLGIGQARTLLAREELTPERIQQLSDAERRGVDVLRRALAYGVSLGLARTTSYRHLIDRDGRGAVQVLTAAPADRLEPLTRWFPLVGRLSYQGFFDPERARRAAAALTAQGYDVDVRPALLYSTLGYFDDPIPRQLLGWSEPDIAKTILHELVHETLFVAGDLDYNEGLATFIAREATLRFLADRPGPQDEARRSFEDDDRYAQLLAALGAELEVVYAQCSSPAEARERRKPVFERYQREVYPSLPWNTSRYAGFQRAELSNAYLIAQRTYLGLLPCFERELAALDGDLAAFVAAHVAAPGHRNCP
jgi:predicted aminopeptidase